MPRLDPARKSYWSSQWIETMVGIRKRVSGKRGGHEFGTGLPWPKTSLKRGFQRINNWGCTIIQSNTGKLVQHVEARRLRAQGKKDREGENRRSIRLNEI